MSTRTKHAVTGAYGYSGKYIATRLLKRRREVVTLTNSPNRPHAFGESVPARPLCFDDPQRLAAALADVDTLYNTYWVRFNHKGFQHSEAVHNTLALFAAARQAGVRRIVHVSITHSDEHSPLEYFSDKGILEKALRESGISHAILRPAVLFGDEDILINNIAWALRKFPVFGVFGDGSYRLRPIHVDDLAELAVSSGEQSEDLTVDAVGPESFAYRELVELIGQSIACPRLILNLPPALGYLASRILGCFVHDVFITREEIQGLMNGLLDVEGPATGNTRLSDWCRNHADRIGRNYASELARRVDRSAPYLAAP
jgi:NADH dehydrogenase